MKTNHKFIYIIEFLTLAYIIIYQFFILRYLKQYEEIITIIYFLIIAFIMFMKMGFYKDNNYLKRYSLRISLVCLLSCLIIIYAIGLITGYNSNALSLKPLNIIKNISPLIIITLTKEYIRYTIAKNNQDQKINLYIITILYIYLGILTNATYYNFTNMESIFRFTCVQALPLIADELLYSYLSYNTSIITTLVVKIPLVIYGYIFPIYPILSEYLKAMIGVILPFLLYVLVRRGVNYHLKGDLSTKKAQTILLLVPLLLIFVIMASLVSGLFRYKIIAIASGSMSGTYERGDAVIYYQFKKDSEKELEEGQIIAFRKENKIITHRIIDISEKNGRTIITTKGDANESLDGFEVYEEEVLGIVKYKIDYIGYPTVWTTEIFAKNKKEENS